MIDETNIPQRGLSPVAAAAVKLAFRRYANASEDMQMLALETIAKRPDDGTAAKAVLKARFDAAKAAKRIAEQTMNGPKASAAVLVQSTPIKPEPGALAHPWIVGSVRRDFAKEKSQAAMPMPGADAETPTTQTIERRPLPKSMRAQPSPIVAEILPARPAEYAAPLPAPLGPTALIDPDAGSEIDWRLGAKSLQNAKTAIAKLGIRCQFDDFHKKFMVHGHPCMRGGAISENLDYMALMVRNEISKTFKLDISKGLVIEALQIKCMEHAFDPIVDYLTSLQWDGTPRLDQWLVDYCGAEDTEYVRAVGRKVLVAAVRRARMPGCKFDYLMVMEGPQGAGKSSALQILAGGENFSDAPVLRLRDKEQQEATGGIWIYEIAELAGKHIDVEHVKQFLSKSVDAARAAYGHARTDQRRRCVFIATTNNDQYLKDTTGNRRFWPVKVGGVNLEALREDRDQLWAEAAVAEATGEPLVIAQTLWGAAAEVTAGRMEVDPWVDVIENKLAGLEAAAAKGKPLATKLFCQGEDDNGPHWRVASEWLLEEVLSIPKARQSNYQMKRLAEVMRRLGWNSNGNAMRFGSAGQKRGFTKARAWEM